MKKLFLIICFLMICTGILMAQNNALKFDGSNDYVEISDNDVLDITGSMTVEAWVNYEVLDGNYYRIVSKGEYNDGWIFGVTYQQTLDFTFNTTQTAYAQTSLQTGKWYHIAAVIDNSAKKIYLYLNGVLDNSGYSFTGNLPATTNTLKIGKSNNGYFSNASVDEVRIWNVARTQAQIRANMYQELNGDESGLVAYYKFNETSGTALDDATANNLDGTLTNMSGGEWQTSAAFAGPKNCLDFDGTDDYVALTDINLDTDFTLEAWINLDDFSESYRSILSKHTSDGLFNYYCEFNLQVQLNDGNLNFFMGNGSYYGVVLNGNNSTDQDIKLSQWHHVAVTVNGVVCTMYLDGVQTDQDNFSGTRQTGSLAIQIGRYNNGDLQLWDGKIEEVRIWNVARTAAQIRENMCKTLTGNETGLVAYYNFDNYSGTKLQDFSGNDNDGTLTNMDAATDWVSSAAFNTWLNTSSTAWSTVTNWSRGSAPASTDNVGIVSYTGGSNPALSGSPTVNNLVVGSGATLTLSSGATVNGNLILESDLDLNGQTITLGSEGKLVESSGFLSGATGQIQTTRDLSNIDENVAGLGAEITTSANMGSTTIIRGHEAQGAQGINRYYQINPTTNTGLSATLIFHYRDAELNGQTESELKLFKSLDGSTWTEQASSTVNTTDNTLTLSGIDGFSSWTAAPAGSDASLPVELVSFTAESRSGSVILKWSTESEVENLGFMLQRKQIEAGEWESVADYRSDAALAGHGTTTEKHDYRYADKDVQPGVTYEYRLGDVDYSGRVTWHREVRVKVEAEDMQMPVEFGLHRAYPNPFNPAVTLSYGVETAGRTTLQVYNLRGQLVETLVSAYQLPGNYDIIWQPENLGAGVYIMRLQSGNKTNLQKIVFVK